MEQEAVATMREFVRTEAGEMRASSQSEWLDALQFAAHLQARNIRIVLALQVRPELDSRTKEPR